MGRPGPHSGSRALCCLYQWLPLFFQLDRVGLVNKSGTACARIEAGENNEIDERRDICDDQGNDERRREGHPVPELRTYGCAWRKVEDVPKHGRRLQVS